MHMTDRFVAIVGASIAGCTAARLFAQAGARVALVERRPDPAPRVESQLLTTHKHAAL
jgi:flavin-dependent dehydrogenase